MSLPLGSLDGQEGVAKREGEIIASVRLRDDRVQEVIEVPRAGLSSGKKPGRIHGEVQVTFPEISDSALNDQLRARASRQRSADEIVFELELDDGDLLLGCVVGGCWGPDTARIESLWFSLNIGDN